MPRYWMPGWASSARIRPEIAPPMTPAVIAKINDDFNAVLSEPAMKERLSTLGFSLVGGEPKALADHLAADIAKWAKVASSPDFAAK